MITKVERQIESNVYICPRCREKIPFPFHGNHLYCSKCHHIEPLYDYGISYPFHRHYTEFNCGPGVCDGN